jgi:flagellar hook-associated protein 3 FlgL
MSDRVTSYSNSMQIDSFIQAMQGRMTTLVGEVSSGQKADPVGSMGSSAALLYQLHTQSDQQNVLQTSIGLASQKMDTIQSVLTGIGSLTQAVSGDVSTAQINGLGTMTDAGAGTLAQQALSTMQQVLGQLNTTYAGSALFAGDSAVPPMQTAGATGGPTATVNAVLSAAVAAKGGPLTASDINGLLNGPDGLSSVFDDTNTNPAQHYSGAFYTAPDDGNPTTVLVGTNQTVQYNAKANQPAFRDLLQGLSMLSLLNAPSSELDTSAKNELATQAGQVLTTAQNELTGLQGSIGSVQAQLQTAVTTQQAAATATQEQIAKYEQANTAADATDLTNLQTQLQATYELTAQISQLSLTRYMPSPA